MRCNQVSIFIERFGEYVPKGYPNDIQRISVYCDDSTSIYAALAKANAMAINELNEYEWDFLLIVRKGTGSEWG